MDSAEIATISPVTSGAKQVKVNLAMTFTNIAWKPALANTSSDEFKALAAYVSEQVG